MNKNNEINNFVKLSKYAGQRFDLVQAGGGNTSVKLDDGTMLIKASGYSLSEVETDKGFSKLKLEALNAILDDQILSAISSKKERDGYVNDRVNESVIGSYCKPSIETLLHAQLGKYVLHTHPIVVNAIICKSNWKEISSQILGDVICIDYKTPGIELALEMHKKLVATAVPGEDLRVARAQACVQKIYKSNIIFLQNHGLIVSAENYETVISLTEEVLKKIEQFTGCYMDEYKMVTRVSQLFDYKFAAYLSQDSYLKKILMEDPKYFYAARFFPDAVVYCGFTCLFINNLSNKNAILEYQKAYGDIPKIIVFEENIFFIAKNLRKAREIEDVFKANLNILSIADKIDGNIEFFSQEECAYLSSWESEKFRKNI